MEMIHLDTNQRKKKGVDEEKIELVGEGYTWASNTCGWLVRQHLQRRIRFRNNIKDLWLYFLLWRKNAQILMGEIN